MSLKHMAMDLLESLSSDKWLFVELFNSLLILTDSKPLNYCSLLEVL